MKWELLIPLLFILFIGIPHGASDILIARRRFKNSWFKDIIFYNRLPFRRYYLYNRLVFLSYFMFGVISVHFWVTFRSARHYQNADFVFEINPSLYLWPNTNNYSHCVSHKRSERDF